MKIKWARLFSSLARNNCEWFPKAISGARYVPNLLLHPVGQFGPGCIDWGSVSPSRHWPGLIAPTVSQIVHSWRLSFTMFTLTGRSISPRRHWPGDQFGLGGIARLNRLSVGSMNEKTERKFSSKYNLPLSVSCRLCKTRSRCETHSGQYRLGKLTSQSAA